MTGVVEELRARIARDGAVRFDEFVEVALYHPGGGFFSGGGGAGRAGADFLTSPEVGPLFGEVVARYLDRRWVELGEPDPFVVIEAAAGRGALAIAVLAAAPRCAAALRYVLVERSDALRRRQAEHLQLAPASTVLDPGVRLGDGAASGPLVASTDELPETECAGVVLANELLDNVPFRLAERTGSGWSEVFVAAGPEGSAGSAAGFVETLRPCDEATAALLEELAPGTATGARAPLQERAGDWLLGALAVIDAGSVLVIDYASDTPALAGRPPEDWLRTYRAQDRGTHPLDAPGSQDVTCEVALDQLARRRPPAMVTTQAAWLLDHGIDELVEEGRRIWAASASAPDLAAIRARSRAVEADALLDPAGLGGFAVAEWHV